MREIGVVFGMGLLWGCIGYLWVMACRERGFPAIAQVGGVLGTIVMAGLSTSTALVILQ